MYLRKAKFLFCFFLGASFLAKASQLGVDVEKCTKALRELREKGEALEHLNPLQVKFMEEVFLPVVGLRALKSAPTRMRQCSVSDKCFELSGFKESKKIKFQWVDQGESPFFTSTDSELILMIPKNFDFSVLPDHGAALIRRFLQGHSLYPYLGNGAEKERSALGEPEFFPKEIQVEAEKVLGAALSQFDASASEPNTLLYVAPTATGKTHLILSGVRNRLEQGDVKLLIIVEKTNNLVQQIQKDIMLLKEKEGFAFEAVRWGEGGSQESISELIHNVRASKNKTILFTTRAGLNARMEKDGQFQENAALIKEELSFFAYDEAFRGGVRVAVGDLGEDGKAEIYTAAGPGGGPHVRIFDEHGKVTGSFFAFEEDLRNGVNVAVW